jgi:phosphoenolpyruvate-protein phosphotransferase (PTS system enzyme I)
MMKYQGTSISRGIVVGTAYLYRPYISKPAPNKLNTGEENEALLRYKMARDAACHELETICRNLADKDKAAIFKAHIDILYDDTLDEEIRDSILDDGYQEDWAIFNVYEKYLQVLGKAKDPLIRERVADFRDIENRLLRCRAGVPEQSLGALEKPVTIVTHDLMPSDTATLDRNMVLGIVTEAGGMTSHSAIIARSYGIPLLCVRDATNLVDDGDWLILDALDGTLVVQPDEREMNVYQKKLDEWLARMEDAARYLSITPVCADGTRIEVELNIGSATPEELDGAAYTDGVGLFRTEFLYMERSQLPSEDEQFELYKKVLSRFGERQVTLRTLDIGGDKTLDCLQLPKEQNPFLGKRALRLSFDDPETFKTQLRASLRASMHGNLWMMFPMVASMDDLRRAKAIVRETQEELSAKSIPYDSRLKLGIMIEIPAIAMMADHVVQEVDFASIGTNDLTQYSLAVDRMNPAISDYYQSYHPALFRLIGSVAEQFRKADKPLCVCGELAGDPLAAAVLIGLGIRKLSMGISAVAGIKKLICGLDLEFAEKLAKRVLELPTAAEVENFLKTSFKDLGI